MPEIPDLELPDELTKTICLRAGSSLRLHVAVTGRPIPTVTWTKPGVDLQNRGFIEVTNTATTLIIDKVHRYDVGRYTIEASNSAGKKDASILVKIYGIFIYFCIYFSHITSWKLFIVHILTYREMMSNQHVNSFSDTPGPTGPIKMKELTKESAHITWDAPEVDGGAPVNNYIIERREASMRAYKTVTSKCSKTSYKITGLTEGMLYYFRVLPENIYGVGEPCETVDVVLVCEVPLPPAKFEVVDVTKSSVSLAWEKPLHDGGSRITGYIVEACKAGTDKWMKVATLKLTDFEFTITSLNENEQYLFRVRAVNSRGAGEPKEIVTAVTVQEQRGMY